VVVSPEERDAEVCFEGLDRAAERGLGKQQFLSGAAKVQVVRDGEEVAELAQVEFGAQIEVSGLPDHTGTVSP
jgi:hypothetical protein